MSSKSANTGLAQYIIPINNDVNSNYYMHQRPGCLQRELATSPFTRGGKFGLLKALRSYDDIFDTLLPRYSVWLKYKEHSKRVFKRSDHLVAYTGRYIPGIIKWPAIMSAPIKLSTASFRNCDIGI